MKYFTMEIEKFEDESVSIRATDRDSDTIFNATMMIEGKDDLTIMIEGKDDLDVLEGELNRETLGYALLKIAEAFLKNG